MKLILQFEYERVIVVFHVKRITALGPLRVCV